MPDAVTDTHALIWYLNGDPRLSATAARWFDECEHDGGRIRVPTISVVELVYLSERGRIPPDTLSRVIAELATPDTVLEVVTLDLPVVSQLANVPRADVPDMPDRIIGATALRWRLPLIRRDRRITLSAVPTVW